MPEDKRSGDTMGDSIVRLNNYIEEMAELYDKSVKRNLQMLAFASSLADKARNMQAAIVNYLAEQEPELEFETQEDAVAWFIDQYGE